MNNLKLEEMTWPEIETALENGYRTVIICAASIEQHGPHLAQLADSAIGEVSAVDLARRLGNALVAPVIRPGLSSHHMPLPGSLTLRPEIFTGLVEDYVTCYKTHGFKNIVLISSHGGNFETLDTIAVDLRSKYADLKIVTGLPLDKLMELLGKMEQEENLPPGTCGGHACDYETSVMLALYPQHVRTDQAKPGYTGRPTREMLNRLYKEGVTTISPTGVIGDPGRASAERGSRYFEMVQAAIHEAVKTALADNS